MYHGEELAKSGAASAMLGGGAVGSSIGQSERAHTAGAVAQIPRTQISVPGLIVQASELQKFAAERAVILDNLALRATDIAARLTGPLPPSQSSRRPPAVGEKLQDASSALDALRQSIRGVGDPLSAMEDMFDRLVLALDAIDGALR